MSNKFDVSLYYATDKNIYDILNLRTVSFAFLYDFLKSKGIIVSQNADRDDLIEYIKQFLIDYYDRAVLLNAFSNHQTKEKKTNKKLKANIDDEQLQNALANVKDVFAEGNENVDISTDGNDTIVTLQYTNVDFSKTELRQKEAKEIKFVISNDGCELKIHSTANEKSTLFVNELKKQIVEAQPEKSVDEITVSLEAIKEPQKRTQFFQDLIYGMDKWTVVDVKNVFVATMSEENSEDNEEQAAAAASIKRVILKGNSVTNTEEYKALKTKGFYIAKLVWTSKETKGFSNDLFEFEAEFGDQEKCTDFKYSCNCYYSYDEEKLKYHSNRNKVPNRTEKELLGLLEVAAEVALRKTLQPSEVPV